MTSEAIPNRVVVPLLTRWGVSPDADRVYRVLSAAGPAPVGQLAQALRLTTRQVQQALDELAEAGAVRATARTGPGRRGADPGGAAPMGPRRWVALPPDVAIARLRRRWVPPVPPAVRNGLVGPTTPPAARLMGPAPSPAARLVGPAASPAAEGGRSGRAAPPSSPSTVELTDREAAVVDLLAAGHTDVSAGRHLGVSTRTVSYALRGLMDRLGVENRFQLGLALGAQGSPELAPRARTPRGPGPRQCDVPPQIIQERRRNA